jgi:uncharacterized protein YfiM (DUF2279 family)
MRLKLLLLSLFFCAHAQAATSELQVRTGLVVSNYSGPVEGTMIAPATIDVEYGVFQSNRRSVNFRLTFATSLPDVKGEYLSAGAGQRFFFGAKGASYEGEGAGVRVSVSPKWRTYVGYDAGLTQMIVKSFGKTIQITSSLIEASANVGCIYQIDEKLGIGAQASAGMGFGFSSVAVMAVNGRLLTGVSYLF